MYIQFVVVVNNMNAAEQRRRFQTQNLITGVIGTIIFIIVLLLLIFFLIKSSDLNNTLNSAKLFIIGINETINDVIEFIINKPPPDIPICQCNCTFRCNSNGGNCTFQCYSNIIVDNGNNMF